MARLSEIVAQNIGNEIANQLIQDGSVMVNGEIEQSDHSLCKYDIIEFSDKRLCYLGSNTKNKFNLFEWLACIQ